MGDKKYMIYGAGKLGRAYLDLMERRGSDADIIGFCDREADRIGQISGRKVSSYEEAKQHDVRFIIAIGDEKTRDGICRMMDADGMEHCTIDEHAGSVGMGRVEFNRELCAVFHIDNMDAYYEDAESKDALRKFWDEGSVFKRMFDSLDLANVIELACGRGRHVPCYLDRAGHITLVDILEENIAHCRERFRGQEKLSYLQNDGHDLGGLESGAYTALFSYDAMVHFELIDIYEYLIDIYRVLAPSGKVLLHHSNNDGDYRASFDNMPHGRSFMGKGVFAHLAHRTGFEVLGQQAIDWEGHVDLDCITLLQKPVGG